MKLLFSFFEKCLHRYKLLIEKLVHALNCSVHWLLIIQTSCMEKMGSTLCLIRSSFNATVFILVIDVVHLLLHIF